MHVLRALSLVALCVMPALGVEKIPLDEYRQRRAQLRKDVGDSVVILFGHSEQENGGDLRTGFFQEANFYYLTGWKETGAILVLTPSSEVLLIPRRDREQEKWTGPKLTPEDSGARGVTGFDTLLASEEFESHIGHWAEQGKKIYTLPGTPASEGLKRVLPLRQFADAALPIARLRMKKSASELALIQRSTDASIDAHFAAWRMIRPGVPEFKVAALMEGTYFAEGCERNAYAPIVGSGPNAAILHYSANRRTIDQGEVVLMDVAGECSMYASDITRTVPVNGKFTPRQRDLYEIVLGAQNAVINATKPGMSLGRVGPTSLNKVARDYFDSHGKDKHGEPLGKYFTHGIGHHVGLDVHDANDPALPLAADMVITVEPGLYIPEEGIGIRIEDIVQVTDNGAKILTSRLPRDPDEIEKFFASR
jgi:Xaa-Pro aminopeptidase